MSEVHLVVIIILPQLTVRCLVTGEQLQEVVTHDVTHLVDNPLVILTVSSLHHEVHLQNVAVLRLVVVLEDFYCVVLLQLCQFDFSVSHVFTIHGTR